MTCLKFNIPNFSRNRQIKAESAARLIEDSKLKCQNVPQRLADASLNLNPELEFLGIDKIDSFNIGSLTRP